MTVDVSFILELGIALGALIGITIGFVYFNTYRFVSILRQTTKRNYGIVEFTTKGKAMFPIIKDFSKDTIRANKGIWFFRAGSIYRQVAKEQGETLQEDEIPVEYQTKGSFGIFSKKKTTTGKLHHTISPDEINFRQGVPKVYLDIDDMIPLKLVKDNMEEEPKSRNPYQVEATLGKEVAAARLEALNAAEKNLKNLIIIVAILVLVGIAMSYLNYDVSNRVGAMVFNLTQRIP